MANQDGAEVGGKTLEVGDEVILTGSSWGDLGIQDLNAKVYEVDGDNIWVKHGSVVYIAYNLDDGRDYSATLVDTANVAPTATKVEPEVDDDLWVGDSELDSLLQDEELDTLDHAEGNLEYRVGGASDFEDEVWQVLIPLGKMLVRKNEQYGDAALNPRNVFSKLPPGEGIKLRMDDKLSRIERGDGTGDEDAFADLAGYLVLLKIAERRAGN